MHNFDGFPPGRQELITMPAMFFSELMPHIDHLVEMKVTLYCLWAVQAQTGDYRYVRFSEACRDEQFLMGIHARPDDLIDVVRDGFERAVIRGSLLHTGLTLATDKTEDLYFINTEKGREAVEKIKNQEWLPDQAMRPIGLNSITPSVYATYERAIGVLTPMIAEHIEDAVKMYGDGEVRYAIDRAVINDKRSWWYINAVLKNRAKDGKNGTTPHNAVDHLQSIEARFADLIEDDDHAAG